MNKLQFRVLFRQFLFRMVDVELLSPAAHGNISNLLGRFAALLIIATLWLALGVLFTTSLRLPPAMRLLAILAEEHFLIATTILAVGLFGVMCWDSIFPDRRDVLVLAPLPISSRTLLMAKAVAVAAGLGLSVGVLNALTGLAVPLSFASTPPIRNFLDAAAVLGGVSSHPLNPILASIRLFGAYWITMLAAGTFTFCFVVSLQGIAQLLPRQKFLRVSAVLQIAAFLFFIGMYFTQLPFASPTDLLSPQNQKLLPWLPSYWFFGMFQQLNGSSMFSSGPAQLTLFVRRAWIGLAASLGGAIGSYVLCYFRTLRKIAEQPDILPARAGLHWLPRFGGVLQTAVVHFSIRTLLRSRRHRVTLAFYLGIALGLILLGSKDPTVQALGTDGGWHQPNVPMLATSVLVMACAIVGIRVAFSMPLDLRANWIFRVAPIPGGTSILKATRRSLWVLTVAPAWLASAAVFFWFWPWQQAAGHLAVLGLAAVIVAEFCLLRFRKIPFTCSYLPGKTQFHMAALAYLGVALIVGDGMKWEQSALTQDRRSLIEGLAALTIAVCALRWYAWNAAKSDEEPIEFEETPTPAVMVLGLNRDGTSPV